MTPEEIKELNKKIWEKSDSWYEGIFTEPSMIPVHIKEPVIYRRYETGGYSGGSCYGGKANRYERNIEGLEFVALDIILEKICPEITYLQYKKISNLIHSNEETEYEYYGNSTDWKIDYIILSELEEFIKNGKN